MNDHKGMLREVRDYLDDLSRLGNGDRLGNSDGNLLAQCAMAKLDAFLAAVPEGLDGIRGMEDRGIAYKAAALLHEATKGE